MNGPGGIVTGEMLDTLQTFETPEGVELGLKLAGPAPRAIAWSIDAAIKLVVFILAATLLEVLGDTGLGIALVVLFVVFWLYNVLFEVYAHGATPGKKLMCLRVVNANGTPVSWAGSVIRNLLRAVDMLPLFYGAGVLCSLLNRRFQRLGDMAANTVVVYQARPQPVARTGTARSAPLGLPLSLEEQRWILAFSERGSQLTRDRQVELAEILEQVTGERGDAAADTLHAYGNWLAGRS